VARGEGAHRRSGSRTAWYRDGRVLAGAAFLVLAVIMAFLVRSREDGARTSVQSGAGLAAASGPATRSPARSPSASAADATPSPSPTATPSPTAGPPVAVQNCSKAIAVAEDVLHAGELGMTHWRKHVAAQTDYVAGRATAARTAATWKRTRLAGPADVQRFRAPWARFARMARPCAGVGSVAAPYKDEARTCLARERVAATAATAMQAVIRDWTDHQHHMAQLRSGDLAAVQAQKMWIQAWRRAPIAQRARVAAQAALDRAPRCTI